MLVRVILVDVNPKMIAAWQSTFAEQKEIEVISGSMLAQQVSAWVTPTNSKGNMDGGLDGVIRKHFGAKIEKSVK